MATITPTTDLREFDEPSVVSWGTITHADQGGSAELNSGLKRGTVILSGTYGGSDNFRIQGSIDGTNWATLRDVSNNSMSTTTGGASFEFETAARYIKVFVTNGGGSSSVACQIIYFLKRITTERRRL